MLWKWHELCLIKFKVIKCGGTVYRMNGTSTNHPKEKEPKMKTWNNYLAALLLMFGLAIASSAMAGTAWVSVPSTADTSDKLVIKAGNLTPWSTVSVCVTHSNGAKTTQLVTATAAGTLSLEYRPSLPGAHTVKIYKQDGTEIGGGNFGYLK